VAITAGIVFFFRVGSRDSGPVTGLAIVQPGADCFLKNLHEMIGIRVVRMPGIGPRRNDLRIAQGG
jgi:hypothetical protein